MLLWELVWKHRVILPALGMFLGMGAAFAWAVAAHGSANPWWLGYVRGTTLVMFLASLLLSYAPFTLMETYSGWRMNTTITRWFTLPVRTPMLVLLPFAAAAAGLAAVFLLWAPLLDRVMGPGLDRSYFLATLWLGTALLQAVAWTLPRRPAQFWAVAGLVMPTILLLALIPQDQPGSWRQAAIPWFLGLVVALGGFAWFAASRNRCGDWPGHLPLEVAGDWLRGSRDWRRPYRSASAALRASDAFPALRFLTVSWLLLAALVVGWALLMHSHRSRGGPTQFEIIVYAAVQLLPFLGLLWLAGWGLTLGNQPGSGFRTALTHFRATLPVNVTKLAIARMVGLGCGWLLVWLPLLLLGRFYLPHVRGVWDADGVVAVQTLLAWRMAIGANLVVGALPVLLRGRLEGFPNVLLAGMCAWAGTWCLADFLGAQTPGPAHWWIAAGLLGAKLVVAGLILRHTVRHGLASPRFACALVLAWMAVAGLAASLLPSAFEHPWQLLGLCLMSPLARLSFCPLALAANRCR